MAKLHSLWPATTRILVWNAKRCLPGVPPHGRGRPNSWSSATNPAPPPQPRTISRRVATRDVDHRGNECCRIVAMVLSGVSPVEPAIAQLLNWGANYGPLTLQGQPWRLLTANYVHIGIIHIALNMWCLWNLGFLAERIFGGWTYFLIYTICGIAGSLASTLVSIWLHPNVVGAGAVRGLFSELPERS